MAYEDMPGGVYALPCHGTTIRSIVKPGALYLPSQERPGFSLACAAVVPARTELRLTAF
jgi:hypothetical protein